FLSRGIPQKSGGEPAEALVLIGATLAQLNGDDPAATQEIDADASAQPVFVNQSDAPAIVPPPGIAGAPERGGQLTADVTDDVFALITLTAECPDNPAFGFVDAEGNAKTPWPVYHVRFKSRSSIWTYVDKATGAVKPPEGTPLPLTHFGNTD